MRSSGQTAGVGFCLLLGVGDLVVLNSVLVPGYMQATEDLDARPVQVQAEPTRPKEQALAMQGAHPEPEVERSRAEPPAVEAEPPAAEAPAVEPPAAEAPAAEAPAVEAEAPAAQAEAPAAEAVVRTQAWIVTFGHNSTELSVRARRNLRAAASVAVKGASKVKVEGHANDIGPAAYNTVLSQKRAEQVMSWLKRHGVRPDNIELGWHGEDQPRVLSKSNAARHMNRRVEITVVGP